MPHSFLQQVTWKRNESETSVVCTGLGKCTFELATRGKCFSWRGSLSQGKTTTFHSPNGSRCIRCPSPAVEWFKISVKDYLPVLGYFFFSHCWTIFNVFLSHFDAGWVQSGVQINGDHQNWIQTIPQGSFAGSWLLFFPHFWIIFNVFSSHFGVGRVESGAQTNPVVHQWMVITKSGFKLSIKDRFLVLGYFFLYIDFDIVEPFSTSFWATLVLVGYNLVLKPIPWSTNEWWSPNLDSNYP